MLREFTKGTNTYAIRTKFDPVYSDEISLHFRDKEAIQKFFDNTMKDKSSHSAILLIAKNVTPSCCYRTVKSAPQLSDRDLIDKLFEKIFSGELKLVQKSKRMINSIDPIGWFDWDSFFKDPRVQPNFHDLPESVQIATIKAWQKEKSPLKITEIFTPTKSSSSHSSGGTVGVGGSFTAGTGKAVSATVLLVFDSYGNVGYLQSAGGGGMGGSSVSGTFLIQVTNAKDIYKLKGLSVQTGGSIGEGLTAGIEYINGNDYSGVNFSFGLGEGLTIGELHSIAEYASVKGANVEDIIDYIKKIKLEN